jgi:Metal-sensitive transcriptional repressor
MTHTVREKQKLLTRVRRIRGQVEAIERALDGEAGWGSKRLEPPVVNKLCI